MTPSEVWKIADVYMWGGNYFTEDDIIFLKKLSRYYNKSDLNRLENFRAQYYCSKLFSNLQKRHFHTLFSAPTAIIDKPPFISNSTTSPHRGGGNRGNPFLEIQEHRHHKSKK